MKPLSVKNFVKLSASVSHDNRPQNILKVPVSESFEGVAKGPGLAFAAGVSSSELSYSELSSSELSFLAFLAGAAAGAAFRLVAAGFSSSSDSSSLLSSSELDSSSSAAAAAETKHKLFANYRNKLPRKWKKSHYFRY